MSPPTLGCGAVGRLLWLRKGAVLVFARDKRGALADKDERLIVSNGRVPTCSDLAQKSAVRFHGEKVQMAADAKGVDEVLSEEQNRVRRRSSFDPRSPMMKAGGSASTRMAAVILAKRGLARDEHDCTAPTVRLRRVEQRFYRRLFFC